MSSTISSSVVNAINGTGSTSSSGSTSGSNSAGDLRSNFMTMLVTQLKNQDPLNPLDNSQMTSQLAQINTLSGIEELNKTLQSITGQIDASQSLQAAALIGREVLVPGDRVSVGNAGQTTPFGIDLASAADQVKVSIYDNAGNLVRQFDLGAQEAGVQSFSWDGSLDAGGTAAAGTYKVAVAATTDGKAQDATVLTYGQVGSIANSSSGPLLDLGAILGQVSLQSVRQIL